jgi:FkbM family methyltransferase
VSTRTIHKNGISFRIRDDEHQRFWSKIEDGVWEPETFGIFDRFVTRDTTCLDVGCWEGPTLFYAGQLGKVAYGFEADPVAFSGLQRNKDANPELTHIHVLHKCVSARTGDVQFGSRAAGGDTMSSMLFAKGQTAWTVPGIRLDEFAAQEKLESPIFLKIDTEGGEYEIMPSLDEFFRKYRTTLYLSTHPGFFGSVTTSLLAKIRAHFGLVFALRHFPYLYDDHGNRIRLWELLLKKKWRQHVTIIATYMPWPELPQRSSSSEKSAGTVPRSTSTPL